MTFRSSTTWQTTALLACLAASGGCRSEPDTPAHPSPPAQVRPIRGTDLHRVILSVRAMERIGLQTKPVAEQRVLATRLSEGGRGWGTRRVVPYSALLYDATGATWVYMCTKPNTFVRSEVEVDWIENDRVFLRSGPQVGIEVATVGVAELYGSEFEVGH